ncbi:solute carrier family 35 (GDP-fucose transporter), member C1 [Mytilus galloprovincialis]|uniref:Solute carrier family 35 (GDP-fucose transporter), member C1 n=1 Tax=Mytilus galloprovincialis TaxID=29158 RepID=A0A8B6BW67_MYTGA|nr:solute carrier family 35 (GDP-fucose transporter), member C1 [Mytilus galloprovincialis]
MVEKKSSIGKVCSVIILYWGVSISMVFVNKHILSGSFGDNDVSIFVAWYQCFSAVVGIQLCGFISRKTKIPVKIPKIEWNLLLKKDFLRFSFAFVASLTMNNLMLKHIGVAFYQVARSWTLIFTILFSQCLLKKDITYKAIIACLIVTCGFFIGIDQEDASGTLSVWGIIYGIFASLATALGGIFIKRVQPIVEGDSFKQAYYNNVNGVIIFFPLVLSTGQLQQILYSEFIFHPSFWICMTISGVLSLSIGWVSVLQIKHTSPITHHVSNTAKSVLMTVLAIMYFNEEKTMLWWGGNFLVIFGVMFYTYSRMNEKVDQQLPDLTIEPENKHSHIV